MSRRNMRTSAEQLEDMPRKMFFRVLPPSMISALTLALANIADALVVGNNRRNCLSLVAYDRGGHVVARNYALFNYVPKGFTIRFR